MCIIRTADPITFAEKKGCFRKVATSTPLDTVETHSV